MVERNKQLRDLAPVGSDDDVRGGISNQPFTPHSRRLTLRKLSIRNLSVDSINSPTIGTLETGPPPTAGC